MIASGFNKHITFERETTTINSLGNPIETYAFFKESWASFRMLRGNTLYGEGALPYTEAEFVVRYDPSIDYSCRIYCDGQYYKIKHIWTEGRQDYTHITAIVFEEE